MFIYSRWFQICKPFNNISKNQHFYNRMNKMRPAVKRDTSYTLSLFALKFAFEIEVHIKIQKTYL